MAGGFFTSAKPPLWAAMISAFRRISSSSSIQMERSKNTTAALFPPIGLGPPSRNDTRAYCKSRVLTLCLLLLGTITAPAQTVSSAADDPLRHGHALLI